MEKTFRKVMKKTKNQSKNTFLKYFQTLFLLQVDIRDSLLSNLSKNDLLNLRVVNKNIKTIVDSYINRNLTMKININQLNFDSVLQNQINFELKHISFNEAVINSLDGLQSLLANCTRLEFYNCELNVQLLEILQLCPNIEELYLKYAPLAEENLRNFYTVDSILPTIKIASFDCEINNRIVAEMMFISVYHMPSVNVIGMN